MKVKIDWPLVCKLTYQIDNELLQTLERHYIKGKGQNDHVIIRAEEFKRIIYMILDSTKNIRRCRTYEQKRP